MSRAIDQLMQIQTYVEQRPHVFRSVDSFRWYMRKHRVALIERGALARPTGHWLVNAAACDAFVMQFLPAAGSPEH